MAAEADAGTIVQCARCNEWEWAEDLYECDQCGELVCIKCLAVPGSDNNESVCRDCPAFPQARDDRIADGELTPADAEWLAGQAEERGDLEESNDE